VSGGDLVRQAVVVAVAARTSVGVTAEGTAAAVRARVSRITEHPFMVDASGQSLRGARDSIIPADLSGADRLVALAQPALQELVAKLTARAGTLSALPIVMALPEPRPGHSRQDDEALVRALKSSVYPGVRRITVELDGQGHAGALRALERAVNAVGSGQVEICVAGGVDSYFQADSLDWLEQHRRVARSGAVGGFPPGEAAGFVAVAGEEPRRRLALPSLAQVLGVASAREARSIDSDEGLLGEALSNALETAAAAAARSRTSPPEPIGDIFCDINGERWRTDDWGFAVLRTSHLFRDATTYETGVGEWGDVGAAGGALGCVLAVQAWRRQYATARRAMIWGSSWGGLRAAAVLEQPGG
jgi:3-oxoacyl-[acyl-carrier-protein] synthase I